MGAVNMTNYELFLEALCEARTQDSEMFNYFMDEGIMKYQYRKGQKKVYEDKQTFNVVPNWYANFKGMGIAQLIKQMEHRATLYDLAITAYLKVFGEGD
jgi:hypothetical protein